MTTKDTIFKVKDGYILLEDLENWYSNGFFTPNDSIRIFEGKKTGHYRISTLIEIYGDQIPFRRIPRGSSAINESSVVYEESINRKVEVSEEPIVSQKVTAVQEEDSLIDQHTVSNIPIVTNESTVISEDTVPTQPTMTGKAGISDEASVIQKVSVGQEATVTYSHDKIGNKDRIPLLSLPARNSQKSYQKTFNQSFKRMEKQIQERGNTPGKTTNWKCDYCSNTLKTVKFSNELEAFQHIITQKHKEMMKFIAPPDDLKFWINWVESGVTVAKGIKEVPEVKATPKSILNPIPEIVKNRPRVPLLDLPYSKDLEKCAQRTFVIALRNLEAHLKTAKLSSTIQNWSCEYCGGQRRLTSELKALEHILTQRHKEKMKFTAPITDLKFWTDKIPNENLKEAKRDQTTVVPEPKKPAEDIPQTPCIQNAVQKVPAGKVQRSTPHVLNKISKNPPKIVNSQTGGTEKNEPFKKPYNDPRIPLLDVPQSQGRLMSQVAFKARYLEITETLETKKSSKETNRKLSCICYHCPGTPKLKTVVQVIWHVFNGKHCENIRHSANELDFVYYEELVKTMISTTVSKESNAVPNTVFTSTTTVPKKLVTASASVTHIDAVPTEIPKKSACASATASQKTLATVHLTVSRNLNDISPIIPKKAITTPKVSPTASNNPNFVLATIRENTQATVSSADFTGVSQEADLNRTPISIVTPTPQASNQQGSIRPTVVTRNCTLPLFVTKDQMGPRTDETCIGPRNSQIVYLQRLQGNPYEWPTSFIWEQTKCAICNVDITYWSTIKMARHALSVEHLYNLFQTGTNFYTVDFEWWLLKTIEDPTLMYPPHYFGNDLPVVCCLGGIRSINWEPWKCEFNNFSLEEVKLIQNMDDKKVNLRAEELLSTFGGCVYCKQWFATGIEVLQHYTSNEHFDKVRAHHPVEKSRVTQLMVFVEQCQKEESFSRCSIM